MSVFYDVKNFFVKPENAPLRNSAWKRYKTAGNLFLTLSAIDAIYLTNLVATAISSPVTSPLLLLNIAFSSATTLVFKDISKVAYNAYNASTDNNNKIQNEVRNASDTTELCDVFYKDTTIVSLAYRILRVKPETRARPLGVLPLFADIQTDRI